MLQHRAVSSNKLGARSAILEGIKGPALL